MKHPAVREKYSGVPRLIEKEFDVNYGTGRIIFIEHCNDMWAEEIPGGWIRRILYHCQLYPENTYIFQTKNPERYNKWLDIMPPNKMLGCTVETIDEVVARRVSKAPSPKDRLTVMDRLSLREKTFITIEPILYGNMDELALWINGVCPEFVNIGADSKGTGLEEPTAEEVTYLIERIKKAGIEIRQKHNLERLLV
jgi:DNA repair photolyase